ncbi:hypothetical protein [Mycobacterium sp.]|uniref:hypothetical protein n=1 Tax=Mycobacterium sp. TaxID=1785 RepID=UPI0025EFEF43|nr:hypothetical protein [Mycobacterium sp.]MBW0014588.1 hypothetical protein [Mycobacterium sp.]
MKFTLNILENRSDGERRWPRYIFGGHMRTSTLVLIVAFLAVWWVYDAYRPHPPPAAPPAQVVPPGFLPDPNYTWVPKSRVQQPPTTMSTPTTTAPPTPTTPTTVAPPSPTATTTSPPFGVPTLPCVLPPPFCPPSPGQMAPQPGGLPAPPPPPPAS